jgi:glycosyltransferase involved in cell wall biosynthesis
VSRPTLTAVVPTVLRPSVREAVAGARAQLDVPVEVVVVVDRARADCTREQLALVADADQTLFTGGGRGGGHARNLGVAAAGGTLVGFLDDDDLWLPDKTRHQLRLLRTDDAGPAGLATDLVVGSRVRERHAVTGETSVPVPAGTIAGERVEDYLFLRRRPAVGRASLFTSTLLAHADLARAVRWDESLRRHQDWDWLVRAQDEGGARFVHAPEVTTLYAIGSPGSISARPDWRSSLGWAAARREGWATQTYVDFVAGQTLRYAVQARSVAGVRASLAAIGRARTLPTAGPAVLAAGSVVPRPLVERALVRRGRKQAAA